MRRRVWFILAVGLQVTFLVIMIGMKWSTLAFGTKIMLKTRPVDPWDLFRGDYVTLNYDISELDLNTVPADRKDFKRNETVYVVLKQQDKYWEPSAVSHQKPPDGSLFIRGTVMYGYDNRLRVNYGIESYYVPQHKGRDIERSRVLPEVEVSVDRRGNSALSRLFIDGKEVKFE